MKPQRYFAIVRPDGSALPAARLLAIEHALRSWQSSTEVRTTTFLLRVGEGTMVASSPSHHTVGPTFGAIARSGSGGGSTDAQSRMIEVRWGAYVDFAMHAGGAISVLRDPSGGLPCYWIRAPDLVAFASDVSLLEESGLLVPTIDWRGVTRTLLAIQYRDRKTALIGVNEILPGERLVIANGEASTEIIWSPWHHCVASGRIDDRRTATAELEATILHIHAAWASLFERPLLSLSGGLDSSIVAAALAACGTGFDCYTLATDIAAGDERAEARLVADHLGIPLSEHMFDVGRIDPTATAGVHLPRPGARAFLQETDRISLTLAAELGSDGWFHGGGGDNVFSSIYSVAPILDRLATVGIDRAAWHTVRDVANLTGADVWSIGRHLVARLRQRRRAYRWTVDRALLTGEAIADAAFSPDHLWLRPPPDALAGKATHVANLLAIQNYLEGGRRERSLFSVAPLLSQPLLELCLRIPSWLWIDGGVNRAIARAAFRDRLPKSILDRRRKGTADAVRAELFERHRLLLRPMLLDGLLARNRIIDAAAVERVLADPLPAKGGGYERVMTLCDVEAWARSVDSGGLGSRERADATA